LVFQSRTVTCFVNTSKGDLWLGTLNGVVSFINGDWTIYNKKNSNLQDVFINTIAVDSKDNIWCGTNHAGIAKFENDEWIIFDTENTPLPVNRINAMNISDGDVKWLGTSYGLIKYSGSSFFTTDISNSGLPDNMVTCFEFFDKKYWIGTNNGGLAEFDGESWNVYNEDNSGIPDNSIRCLAVDNQNNFWVGTKLSGLCKWSGKDDVEVFDTDNSDIPGNNIFALIPEDDHLWIGTLRDGIAKFDGTDFTVYNTENSDIPSNNIASMALDSNKCLWVATYENGIAKLDNDGIFTSYNMENSELPFNKISSICCDTNNIIWVATGSIGWSGEGLAKFDGENWEIYTQDNSGLVNDTLHYVIADKFNNIWVSTLKGISRFDGNEWETFTKENSGLQDNFVFPVFIDQNDNKWIGTYNSGVSVYREDGVIFGKLPEKPAPPSELTAELVNDSTDAYLEWMPSPSSGVTYRIYRKKAAAGEFEFSLYTENISETNFLDTAFADGVDHYYFIRAYDANTKLESINSNTVIIQRPSSVITDHLGSVISIYPNPSDGRFEIEINGLAGKYADICLFDHFGKKVKNIYSGIISDSNYALEWTAGNLTSSVYYFHLKTKDRVYVHPIILIGKD
jgi:sugar lactone lactonase YvrE